MKPAFYTFLLCFFGVAPARSQMLTQYFDGADTVQYASIFVHTDTGSGNVWQVGKPSKTLFNQAATAPRAIVTDTAAPYPPSRSSAFYFTHVEQPFGITGVLAVRWKQKLDLDTGLDGAVVEFSSNGGNTWKNAFTDPLVYNFYGYNLANQDTLPSGQVCFSGRDTAWRDIWLCFQGSWLYTVDSIQFRFTLKSDSAHTGKEGWMVDNLLMHRTMIHTVKRTESTKYLTVYPTQTTGRVHIEAEPRPDFHIIEHMSLAASDGRVVQRWDERLPTKYFIDIGAHPDGLYYLTVATNVAIETVPVVLRK